MKYFNGLFALLFLYFIIVQYNDPDPLLWVTIYSYALLVTILMIIGRAKKYFLYGGTIIFAVLAATLVPGVIDYFNASNYGEIFSEMAKERLYVEESREFFGLLIAMVPMVVGLVKWQD